MVSVIAKTLLVLTFTVVSQLHAFAAKGRAESDAGNPDTRIHINSMADSVIRLLPSEVEAIFHESGLASLSIAVVYDRDIVYSQAFGFADLEKNIAATTKTLHPIASITKVFVATMLVQLAEAGIVTLDMPVKGLLPEYQVKSPFAGTQPTTLRQLAMHTSGLPREAPLDFWSDLAAANWLLTGGSSEMKWYVSKEELLASLPQIELEYPPNSCYSYSNLGMALLGIALERAAGKPFTEYIESNILNPLGMHDSGFLLNAEHPSRVATGYVYLHPESELLIAPEWELGSALYSGGLYSTTEDMARFLSLQFQHADRDAPQIVSPDGLRMMHLESLGWGLGWDPKHPAIEHTGGHLGFYAHVRAIPTLKIGIVALTNSNNPLMDEKPSRDIARGILEELKQAILGGSVADSFDPEQIDLNKYVGTYTLPGGKAEMIVELREGQLHVRLLQDSTFNYSIVPVGVNEFGNADDPDKTAWFSFQTDDAGKVESLKSLEFTFKRNQ